MAPLLYSLQFRGFTASPAPQGLDARRIASSLLLSDSGEITEKQLGVPFTKGEGNAG